MTNDDTDNELTPAVPQSDAGARATPEAAGTAQARPSARETASTHIAGSALVPDIAARSRATGVARQFKYWIGVSPGCPVESIRLAGVCFPKVNQKLVPDPNRSGKKARVPVVGAIVWLNEDKIRALRERLPRTVIRFQNAEAIIEEPGTGENIGDNAVRPSKGKVITIPTNEEIAFRKKRGKPTNEYVPDTTRDVPASRFMFAQICDDQVNGERGEFYPEPVETAGLAWPDALEDETARLLS